MCMLERGNWNMTCCKIQVECVGVCVCVCRTSSGRIIKIHEALIRRFLSSHVLSCKRIKAVPEALSFMSPLRLLFARSSTNSRVQRWRSTKTAGSIPGQLSLIIHLSCFKLRSVQSLILCVFDLLTFRFSLQVPSALGVQAVQ